MVKKAMTITKIEIIEDMNIDMIKIHVGIRATIPEKNMSKIMSLALMNSMERIKILSMVLMMIMGHMSSITRPITNMKVM